MSSGYFSFNEPERKLEPPKEIVKELFAAPVEAYRVWAVHRPEALTLTKQIAADMAAAFDAGRNPFTGLFGARLAGIGHAIPWESATHTAECSAERNPYYSLSLSASGGSTVKHDAPQKDCTCGVWAVKDDAAMRETLREYRKTGVPVAFGKVQMWGRIYEHRRGYRAQYARPLEVTLAGGDEALAAELAAFYGCPVVVGALPVLPPAKQDYFYGGLQVRSGATYVSAVSAYQAQMNSHLVTISNGMLYGSPVSARERTHGSPSSFAECSKRWAEQYSSAEQAASPSFLARLFSRSPRPEGAA